MLQQLKFSTKTIFPSTKFSSKPFVNSTGVELSGITHETQRVALELLQDNHKKHDIFFNDRGLHDHFVHHILAAYSCGGSSDLLRKIAKNATQRPMLPSKAKITKENWTDHLGDNDMYRDYLEFFDKSIEEEGMQATFEKYAFHHEIFIRLFGGALHPVIHLGYGIEFQIPMIVAEGLAQAAVHEDRTKNLLNEDYISYKGTKSKTVMEIIKDIENDKRFDDVIHYEDNGKIRIALTKLVDPIREHAKDWVIPETEEGVLAATQEHFESVALLFGATAIRPDKEKLEIDFFLMHALTSILLIYNMLPYVNLEKKIMLLRAHFAATLSEYVARGRPKIHIEELKNFTPKKLSNEPNPWIDIVKFALLLDKESHIIKVVRSLIKAEHEWGSGKDNLYAKIAQLTCEAYDTYGFSDDIGFDQSWA